MTFAHKKYFANFIKSGGNYKSFWAEYLRIFKKETSRGTFTRLKLDFEKKSPCQHYCEYKLLRKTYINFVVYNSNKKIGQWWYFQMGNDQIKFFLKQKYPNTRFELLLENVPSHFHIDHPYLKLIYLSANSTARTSFGFEWVWYAREPIF